MDLTKKDFDLQLKEDSAANNFRVEGNYIVFDKTSNLNYQILPDFTLGDLLTKNPIASYTKLNKDLLVRLNMFALGYLQGHPNEGASKIKINSSYRSPEYNMTVFGALKNSKHTTGDALDLGVSDVGGFFAAVTSFNYGGEIDLYNWGMTYAVANGSIVRDHRTPVTLMSKVKDAIAPDTNRNWLMIGLVALCSFVFIRKVFK